ncbi:MAG TPA: type II secretion system protein GspJ [Myxococcales bacterium LLY-WYZ-16_1]|jgi:general secretion pathway protein J|nr:type II secretion system protein GspJ [Myxococcales bacterium LLY-WYZ-16_1]
MRTRSPNRASRRGLTLIEIALAVGMLALMATLTWGSLARSFDAFDTVTRIDRRYHEIRVAMNRMARELSMAFLTSRARHLGPERVAETLFRAEAGAQFYEIHFTTFAHDMLRANAKESDQCEIAYFGRSDPEKKGVMNLVRREDPRLDREPDEGGREYVLAENITSFQMRFWNERKQDWSDEWDTESPDFAGFLPSVVEIRMTTEDEAGEELEFVTKTRINLTRELGRI